ncbi:hypothetical protein [Curtobacterium luteum]|uniref:DUF559 domain-containing protein n=1 Tax=Curtobacterium luteum TaxID=33881 RepID=A0A175RGV4_9MICO|nr:hypothetical protein [Curtobacterium luteum]KTR02513.1 hypothetical protein NS184_15595 [Curtobacterium luteum]
MHRGTLAAVRPGVLVDPELLIGLRPEDRHLLLVRATAPDVVAPARVSHLSAAVVHGLPVIGAAPDRVDVTDPRRGRTDTTAHTRRRPGGPGADHSAQRWSSAPCVHDAECDGAVVTSLVRTLVDVAATKAALTSVPMIDHALHDGRVWPEMLAFEAADGGRDLPQRASAALSMGSALSGSPAESLCRVRFRQLGTPDPVQQHEFRRPGEPPANVDFWFPDQGVVVEVDGRGKYEDAGMLGGASTADAHWREKRREDFVRSFPEVRFVLRLTWRDLMHPERVRDALRRAGVPCR